MRQLGIFMTNALKGKCLTGPCGNSSAAGYVSLLTLPCRGYNVKVQCAGEVRQQAAALHMPLRHIFVALRD